MNKERRSIFEDQKNLLTYITPNEVRYDFEATTRRDHSSLINFMHGGVRGQKPEGISVIQHMPTGEVYAPNRRVDVDQVQRKRANLKYSQYQCPGDIYNVSDYRANGVEVINKIKAPENRKFVAGRVRNNVLIKDIAMDVNPRNPSIDPLTPFPTWTTERERKILRNMLLEKKSRKDFGRHEVFDGIKQNKVNGGFVGPTTRPFKPTKGMQTINPIEIRALSQTPGVRVFDIIDNIGFCWSNEIKELLSRMDLLDRQGTKGGQTTAHISNLILCNKAISDSQQGIIPLVKSPLLTLQQRSMIHNWQMSGLSEQKIIDSLKRVNYNVMKDLNREYSYTPNIESIINHNIQNYANQPGLKDFYQAIYTFDDDETKIHINHGSAFCANQPIHDRVFQREIPINHLGQPGRSLDLGSMDNNARWDLSYQSMGSTGPAFNTSSRLSNNSSLWNYSIGSRPEKSTSFTNYRSY